MGCRAAVLLTIIAIKNRHKTKGKAPIIAARGTAVAPAFQAWGVVVGDGLGAAQQPRQQQGYITPERKTVIKERIEAAIAFITQNYPQILNDVKVKASIDYLREIYRNW